MQIALITYSAHAQKRMRERGIAWADVEATLRSPDLTLPAKAGKRRATRTTANGVAVTVVFAETSTPFGSNLHVVTVW